MREYEEGYPGDANDRYYQGDHPDPDRRNRSNFGFANVKRNAETGGNKVREDATDYLNERLKVLPREETKVLFDQRVEIDAENGNVEECELPFSPGDLVKVTWDGVEYKCTVELYEGNVFLGNPDFVDNGTSNGIPFAMLNGAFDGQYYLAIIAPDYGGQSVSIKIEGNVIHPIDPKYLPGKVVYYWDGESMIVTDASGNAITAEQAGKDMFNVVIYNQITSEYYFPYKCYADDSYAAFWFFVNSGSGGVLYAGTVPK